MNIAPFLIAAAALLLAAGTLRAGPSFAEFADPNPSPGNQFGHSVVVLSNGNVVITSPYDNAAGHSAGAVYLFNGATGQCISTLTGASSSDLVGIGGVVALSNGNFLVLSPLWDNGQIANAAGAVTWGNGITGISGVVSSSNSLVGTQSSDGVGRGGVVVLSNGNYVVCSQDWNNGTNSIAGAVTWGDGTTGITGEVSSSNSLVGSKKYDRVGSGGVRALNNGHFVVSSPNWSHGSAVEAGAVTWGNGTTGVTGIVSSGNSLVGSKTEDQLGSGGVTPLSNGNFVVCSPIWDSGLVSDAGAVTWSNGTAGITGIISSSNSLVGSTTNDRVGSRGVTALSNGNYVVSSPIWDSSPVNNAGAVTWGDGSVGITGVVSNSNSLIGTAADDRVGNEGVTTLSNGNYVVVSAYWRSSTGAVTWSNGTTGTTGEISSGNSLISSNTAGNTGGGGVVALSNGNYVVLSPRWHNNGATYAGAVTWGNGTTGTTGVISKSNSLVGSKSLDYVGNNGVVELSNGNYVVRSLNWNNTRGAVTWGNGTSGTAGEVSSSNSLVGSKASGPYSAFGDQLGIAGVMALSNGNYVVLSPNWDNNDATNAGAVTWGNGTTGTAGEVSNSNSLVGSNAEDQVGGDGMTMLNNGNFVVRSPNWDNDAVANAGAATWGDGAAGTAGVVSSSNSLVGSKAEDQVSKGGVTALSNGNFVVSSPNWDNEAFTNAGAVTWGNGSTGISGVVNSSNSLVGSKAEDLSGSGGVTVLGNGNYAVLSPNWDNDTLTNAGAVTWGNGSTGISGVINSINSLVGLAANTSLQPVVADALNQTFFGRFRNEGNGKVRLGSQIDGIPALRLSCNGVNITRGDSSPSPNDYTDFGPVHAESVSLTQTFTIANSGTADLLFTDSPAVTLTGSVAFSISSQITDNIVAANSSPLTFEITFTPVTLGLHTATVSIANNDPNRQPFTFTIAGRGAKAGSLAFSSSIYSTNSGPVATVVIQRSGGTLPSVPASVTITTSDGDAGIVPPFSAAVAGTDYEAQSTTVNFAANEYTKLVRINLLTKSGYQPNRRFTVTLTSPTNGAILGDITSAEVRLPAPDDKAPTLTIKSPAANTKVIRDAIPLLITGTAGDTQGIDRVDIFVNGTPHAATLGPATKPTSVPWSLELTPPGDGPIYLRILAHDLRGNVSSLLTRRFDFIRRYALEVTRQVPAFHDSPDDAGSLQLTSSKGDFTMLQPVKGATVQTSIVAASAQVTLTAKAAVGSIFSHWEGLPEGHTPAGAAASFQMPAADLTGITAVFVTNPFLNLGSKPVFYGLIEPIEDTPHNNATHGSLTASLVAGSGRLTGKVFLNGLTTSFTGLTLGNGNVWFRAPDKSLLNSLSLPGGDVLTARFESSQLLIEINSSAGISEGLALPVLYSRAMPVPDALLNSATQGFYTVALPAKAQSSARALSTYPQGSGYGSFTLKNNGTLRFAGVLAEGSKFTYASALVTGNATPMHLQLPTPGNTAEKGGSLIGRLAFDPDAPDSDVAGVHLNWYRPAVTERPGSAATALSTQLYTGGWPEGIELDLIGAKYDKTTKVETTLGFGDGPARLIFSGSKLSSDIEVTDFHLSNSKIIKEPAIDQSFTLSFAQGTGLMKGTFTPNWDSPASKLPGFTGVQLGKGANRGGWGFFLSNRAGDLDPEGGRVLLEQP